MPLSDHIKVGLYRPQVVIQGSYYTTNVGDRAIALVLKHELGKRSWKSSLVSHYYSNPRSKNLIIGGGGPFHVLVKRNLKHRTSSLSESANVLCVGVGSQGLTSITPEDRSHLEKLSLAKYISVRDEFSGRELSCYHPGVRVTACPAWLFNQNLGPDRSLRSALFRAYYNLRYRRKRATVAPSSRTKIGIALNGHFDLKWLPAIREELARLSESADLYFIPFVGEDMEFFERELRDLKIHCLKLKDPVETYRAVNQMDKMVVCRYHSLVLSLLARKPVMVLAYATKVVSLATDLALPFTNLVNDQPKSFVFVEGEKARIESMIARAHADMDAMSAHLR
jgi:hypothetical protein